MTTQTQSIINLEQLTTEHLLNHQTIELVTDDDIQSVILTDSIYGKSRRVEIVDNHTVKVYPVTKVGDLPKLKSEIVTVDSVNHYLTYFLHGWWLNDLFTQQETYEYNKANPDWIYEEVTGFNGLDLIVKGLEVPINNQSEDDWELLFEDDDNNVYVPDYPVVGSKCAVYFGADDLVF